MIRTSTKTTRVELHCHSTYSDGYDTPAELAARMAARGVVCAALTDHDTIAGLHVFHDAMDQRGILCVDGVEITADTGGRETHLLAYGFDRNDPELSALLAGIRARRESAGAPTSFPPESAAPAGAPASSEHVIAVVHHAGGRVFLAHPMSLDTGGDSLITLLQQLKQAGLDGMEAQYAQYPAAIRRRLTAIAGELGLVVSHGSDFHGRETPAPVAVGMDVPVADWKKFRDCLGAGADKHPALDKGAPEMPAPPRRAPRGDSALKVVLPTILVMALFTGAMFAVIIPAFETHLLERKREMIRELTHTAWSIIADYERQARAGAMSLPEAKRLALERIRSMRYGAEGKDYFWITDMHPRMLMHPYRPDLDGGDVTDFTDPNGVHLFVEFVRAVRTAGEGYVAYVWQWKDNPEHLAPKESYVKTFAPWGWIIGTGIYIQDVEAEIKRLASRLANISFGIAVISGLLLLYVVRRGLRAEHLRRAAEERLARSHDKYAALVAAAGEGTVMALDGRCSYHNRAIEDMLGYTSREFYLLDLDDILPVESGARATINAELRRLMDGHDNSTTLESQLRRKDGSLVDALMSITRISIGGADGFIFNVKDIRAQKAMVAQLDQTRERYRFLTDAINLGVFRADAKGNILEANPAARRILGLPDDAADSAIALTALFHEPEDRTALLDAISAGERIIARVIRLRRDDGSAPLITLSGVPAANASEDARCFDGIIEDITERWRAASERERLLAELQAGLLFLNQPIRHFSREMPACDLNLSVREAARRMQQAGENAVLAVAGGGEVVGIATDRDMTRRVIAPGMDAGQPLARIMSAPVVSAPDTAMAYEATLIMREQGLRHLGVRGADGKITGIIRDQDLLQFHRYSAAMLSLELEQADTLDELIACHARLPRLVKTLIDSGARSRHITRIITAVSDTIIEKLARFAVRELGAPPARFAFLALGSEGRREQTLVTDQDNALLYEDVPADAAAAAAEYFLQLGQRVCNGMARAGHAFCKADMMARNPKWSRPMAQWKTYFREWIGSDDPRHFLDINIFFDFRCVAGDPELAGALRSRIDEMTRNRAAFFHNFAQTVLLYKPPLGFFGNIVRKSDGGEAGMFDIKAAMGPIVNFARIYALHERVLETNTSDRLRQLQERGTLANADYENVQAAYDFLLQLRFHRQAMAINGGRQPDNLMDPRSLTQIEDSTLRQALTQIVAIQKKIAFDFGGDVIV